MRRLTAARASELGLEGTNFPGLAARLAGGFCRPAEQREANSQGGTPLPEHFAHTRSDQAAHRMAHRIRQSDRDRKAAVERLKRFGPAIVDAMSKGIRRPDLHGRQ